MMPFISSARDTASTLFVFKGKRKPFRQVFIEGYFITETFANLLPRGSLIFMCEEVGRFDRESFFRWATVFIEHIRDLTANGRKALLTYHGYSTT